MLAIIDLAKEVDAIEWIDLRVHAHNRIARRLYESLGFAQVGFVEDRFRIGTESISDVLMTLGLK